jgi:hypothetical protein
MVTCKQHKQNLTVAYTVTLLGPTVVNNLQWQTTVQVFIQQWRDSGATAVLGWLEIKGYLSVMIL